MNKKYKILLSSVFILCVLFLFGMYKFFLPNFIDKENIKKIICSSVHEGHSLNISELDTVLTWDFAIEAKLNKFELFNDKKSILKAKNTKIKIPLIFLAFKKINYAKIYTDYIESDISRDENGAINIMKAFKFNKNSTFVPGLKLYASKYNITFKDYDKNKVIIQGKNFAFDNFKHLKMVSNGSFNWDDNTKTNFSIKMCSKTKTFSKKMFIDLNIDKLNLSKIKKYIKDINPDLVDISGYICGRLFFDNVSPRVISNNLKSNLALSNIKISTKKYENYIVLPDTSELSISGKYSKNKLALSNFDIKSKDYNINILGNISDLNKKSKKLNLELQTKKALISKLVLIIPKTVPVKNDALNKGIKYNLDGLVDSKLQIKGRTTLPEYYGDVNVKKFVVADNYLSSKSYANMHFNKRQIKIDTKLYDSEQRALTISGITNVLVNRSVDLKIYSDKIGLANMHDKLLVFSDILNLKIGPLKKMKLSGLSQMQFSIRGPTKNVHLKGSLRVINSLITHEDFYKSIFVKDSKIVFKKRKILFEDFLSDFQGYSTVLNGYTTLNEDVDVDIKLNDMDLSLGYQFIKNSSALSKIKKELTYVQDLQGKAALDIKLYGNKNDIKSNGKIIFNRSTAYFKDVSAPIQNINGKLTFKNSNCEFDDIRAKFANSLFKSQGSIQNRKIDVHLVSNSVDLNSFFKLVKTSPSMIDLKHRLSDIDKIGGKLSAVIDLGGSVGDKNLFKSISADLINANIVYKNIMVPIHFKNGSFEAKPDSFLAKNIIIETLNSKGQLNGEIKYINEKPKYNLDVAFENLDKNTLYSLKKMKFDSKIDNILSNFAGFGGAASGKFKVTDNLFGHVVFNNLAGVYTPLEIPCCVTSGELIVKNKNIDFENLKIKVGSSKFNLVGNYNLEGHSNVQLLGNLLVNDVDKFLNKLVLLPLNLKQAIPLKLILDKNNNKYILDLGCFLNKGNIISYRGASIGSNESPIILGGRIIKENDKFEFKNIGLSKLADNIDYNSAFTKILSNKNILSLNGNLDKKTSKQKIHFSSDKYLDIKLLNAFIGQNINKFFEDGQFKGNLFIEGSFKSPKLLGTLELNNALIPYLKMKIGNAKLLFDNENVFLKDGTFSIADSNIIVDAIINNVIEKPYLIKDLSVRSSKINIDEIMKVFENDKAQKKSTLPIFTIKNGELSSKQLIINNLITSNAVINFSFTPDWIMSLDKLSLNTAGGNISGESKIDFTTRNIDTNLKFKNIKANAAATTFLQIPNEIYGILNGEARFSTKGIIAKDLIKHANGEASFKINSGRLVRLGSIEYLLMAAEVVKSGVTGLSINNLLTLVSPKKTGSFDTISADFKVKNGIVYSENLISRSENLNMYMAGSFDMSTNYSDIIILGRISKAVTGFLGPVGNFSINKVIHSIPGVKNPNNNVNNIFPNLSKLPGIDFNNDEYRRFLVNIEGNLYETKSVRKFRWLD